MDSVFFSKEHLWAKQDGNTVILGISDYAKEELGWVMFVNLPELGTEVAAGDTLGDIESVKTVSDLISPVAGTVMEVNALVIENPEIINDDPYENWLVKVSCADIPSSLMNEDDYKEYLEGL